MLASKLDMTVRERIAALWRRNPQDEGFSCKVEKEDVSFYLPHGVFADCESGKGGELSLTQHIHFKMLEEQGLAERFANGFALEPETVVNLESDLRLLFGLPDSWPGSLGLITQGSSFQPSFDLNLRLRTASGETAGPYRLEGPFLRLSETERYLPSPAQWLALKAVADHQALEDEARSEYRNLLAVHHVQKAAEAGCDIDLRQFTDLKTVEPERVSVSLERLANGDLELTPNFEGLVSPEQVASRLGQIAPDDDTVQSLRVGNTIILLDEKRLKATQEIIKNRSIPAKYAKQFLASPTAFLDATLVDLDVGYSLRVRGIAEFRHAYFGETEASGIDWFSRAAANTLETSPGLKDLGGVIQDLTDLTEFRERLQDAVKTGADQVTFKEQSIPVDNQDSVERALNELERELQEQSAIEDSQKKPSQIDAEGEERSQAKIVVDVHPNDELLDIRSRYTDSTTGEHLYQNELAWSGYKRQPFPHQEEGIRWLIGLSQRALERPDEESLFGSLLADDMGLGKTFMALVALGEYYRLCAAHGVAQKPVLVVAPLSLLDTWKTEIEQTFVTSPFVDIVTLHRDAGLGHYRLPGRGIEIREQKNRAVLENDDTNQRALLSLKVGEEFGTERLDTPRRLVITNYDTLSNYQFSLCRVDWSFVIFDEAQNIKNPNTMQTRAAKGIKAQFKLMVTGTPVENQLTDFWCIFDTAVPGLLDSYQDFRKTYVRPLLRAGEALPQIRREVGERLRSHVGALMLRRIKEDYLEGLPIKSVYVGVRDTTEKQEYSPSLDCAMSASQLTIYDTVVEATVQGISEGNGPSHFLTGLQRLRDVSLHPDLLGGGELSLPATVQDCQAEARKSGKLAALLNVVDKIKDRQEKVLIFVINKRLQAFLSHALGKIYGMPVAVLNGDTKAVAKRKSILTRQRLIEQFEALDGFGMMIMSPVAAGVGLTITGANNVIHLERHWNPAKEAQATDRVYRIGQSKNVSVFIPVLHHPEHDSFDLHLHRLLAKKVDLKDAVVAPEIVTHESFQQTDIFGQTTAQHAPSLSEKDLDLIGWEQFEALVAELLCRAFDGEVQLTPVSNDKGCDVVLLSARGNLLAQCKHTKYQVLQGDSFIREIYASQKFYANHLVKDFQKLAVFTNARKVSKQGAKAAKVHEVQLYDRAWILKYLRQHSITRFDLLRRLDKPRLTW